MSFIIDASATKKLLPALLLTLLTACGEGPAASGEDGAEPGFEPDDARFGQIELRFEEGSGFTAKSEVTLHILADKATGMYLTDDPACAKGGVWEKYEKSVRWSVRRRNGENRAYLRLRLGKNESSCLTTPLLIHDDVAPVFSLGAPVFDSWLNIASAASVRFEGTCGEEGREVTMTGSWPARFVCSGGAFGGEIDLSGLKDGAVSLKFGLTDSAGNAAPEVTLGLRKDTAPPVASLVIEGGRLATSRERVSLELSTSEAHEMKISEGALCLGGSWESPRARVERVLAAREGANVFSVQLRDEAGNLSDCVSRVIIHDSLPPSPRIAMPASGSFIAERNQRDWALGGTCEGEGSVDLELGTLRVAVPCVTGRWTARLDVSLLAEGPLTALVRQTDLAGNIGEAREQFVKDTLAPSAPVLTLNAGEGFSRTMTVPLRLAVSEDATEIRLSAGSACDGTSWIAPIAERPWTLRDANARNSVSVRARDAAGNESPCVSAAVIHDDQPPIWSARPRLVDRYNSLGRSPKIEYVADASDSHGVRYEYSLGSTDTGVEVRDWVQTASGGFVAEELSLRDGQRVYVRLRAVDPAGNVTVTPAATWLVDVTPPALAVDDPASNEPVPGRDLWIRGRCEGGQNVRLEADAEIEVPLEVPCDKGRFAARVSWTGDLVPRSVRLAQSDGLQDAAVEASWRAVRPLQFEGPVWAVAPAPGGGHYIGGAFRGLVEQPAIGALVSNRDGMRLATFEVAAGFNGVVRASLALADGGFLLGGDFTEYRGRPAPRLARLRADGTLDEKFARTWGTGPNGSVRALAARKDGFYVGGDLTRFGAIAVGRLVRLDEEGALVKGFHESGGFNGSVLALAFAGDALYAGGSFTTYRGAPASRLARLGVDDGVLDAGFNPPSGPNGVSGTVRALLLEADGALLAGGDFVNARDRSASRLVRVAPDGAVLATFGLGFNSGVHTLAALGDELLVGGAFSSYDGHAAGRLVKIDRSGRRDFLFSPSLTAGGFDSTVSALAVEGDRVFVGGSFANYRGRRAPRSALLRDDGSAEPAFAGVEAGSFSGPVLAISAHGDRVLWAGAFTAAAPARPANFLVRVGANGLVDESFQPARIPGFDGAVRALVADDESLFVGGDFGAYRGQALARLAKLRHDGQLDRNFHARAGGFNGAVRAAVLSGEHVLLGGDFTSYRGEAAPRLARVDTLTGENVPWAGMGTGFNSSVSALLTSGDGLFVGGSFTTFNGAPANRLAKLDLRGGALDRAFNPASGANGADGAVTALAGAGEFILAAGSFANYRGRRMDGVAKVALDGSPDEIFHGVSGGLGGGARAIAVDGSSLLVSGPFSSYRGRRALGVVRLDLRDGSLREDFAFERGFAGPSATASVLAPAGEQWLLGGDFRGFGGKPWLNFLRLNSKDGAIAGGL